MATIDIKLKSYNELIFEITKLNTDKYLLQQKIDKAIDFIDNWKKYKKDKGSVEVSMLDLLYIKEILGDKENESR